jgi:hypothetical protein
VALGQVFSENFGLFPLPIYIPFASPQSSSLSPEAGTRSTNSLTNQIRKKVRSDVSNKVLNFNVRVFFYFIIFGILTYLRN